MATQPSSQAVMALFEKVSDPLLVFNVAGAITFANRAARSMAGAPAEALAGHPDVKALVRAVTLGTATLPHHADLQVSVPGRSREFSGTFMTGPSGADVAFLMQSPAAARAAAGGADGPLGTLLSLHQIIELLRNELMPPVREITQAFGALPPNALTEQVERAGAQVNDRLGRLLDLVNVFGDDVLLEDNRVVIPALVRRVCRDVQPEAERQRVEFVLTGEDGELPPIYGSEKLLYRAFRECLENAVRHARREVKHSEPVLVEIRFTPSGTHLLVSVRNRGASSRQQREAQRIQAFAADSDELPTGVKPTLRIGLPLARRIVELHGGHLRVGDPEEDAVQVLMELPTGAPKRGGSRLDIAQAQKYAADLARLMSRQRKEKV